MDGVEMTEEMKEHMAQQVAEALQAQMATMAAAAAAAAQVAAAAAPPAAQGGAQEHNAALDQRYIKPIVTVAIFQQSQHHPADFLFDFVSTISGYTKQGMQPHEYALSRLRLQLHVDHQHMIPLGQQPDSILDALVLLDGRQPGVLQPAPHILGRATKMANAPPQRLSAFLDFWIEHGAIDRPLAVQWLAHMYQQAVEALLSNQTITAQLPQEGAALIEHQQKIVQREARRRRADEKAKAESLAINAVREDALSAKVAELERRLQQLSASTNNGEGQARGKHRGEKKKASAESAADANRRHQRIRCYQCQELGHIASSCPQRQGSDGGEREEEKNGATVNAVRVKIPSANSASSGSLFARSLSVRIGDKIIDALADSGAEVNLINSEVLTGLPLEMVKYQDMAGPFFMTGVGGEPLKASRSVVLPLSIGNRTQRLQFYVSEDVQGALFLGFPALISLDSVMDFKNSELHLRARGTVPACAVRLKERRATPEASKEIHFVRLPEAVELPPRTKQLLVVTSDYADDLLVGEQRLDPDVWITEAVVAGNNAVIMAVNESNNPVWLKQNQAWPAQPFNHEPTPAGLAAAIQSGGPDLEPIRPTINEQLSDEEQQRLRKLVELEKFSPLWKSENNQFGHFRGRQVRLELKPDAKIVRRPQYPLAMHRKQAAVDTVKGLLESGIIEETSVSSTTCIHPFLVVGGAEGKRARFVADLRKINDELLVHVWPLETPDVVFERIAGAQFYSTLDLSSAFYSLELDEESRELMAFYAPLSADGQQQRLFRYCRLPFGCVSASSLFAEALTEVLAGSGAICYIDDICIATRTLAEHLEMLEDVLDRLLHAGFVLGGKKCRIGFFETAYLGYLISSRGLVPDPNNVSAILALPLPTNKKELMSICGSINFFRNHIPQHATWVEPLTALTKKDAIFEWGPAQVKAWSCLLEMLTSAPLLQPPIVGRPFVIFTDASQVGVGAIICQRIDGRLVVNAYVSWALTSAQRSYDVHEKEVLALAKVLDAKHRWFAGAHIDAYTDNAAASYLNRNFNVLKQQSRERLLRQTMAINSFDLVLHHLPGKDNEVADLLSRLMADGTALLHDELAIADRLDIQIPAQVNIVTRSGAGYDVPAVHLPPTLPPPPQASDSDEPAPAAPLAPVGTVVLGYDHSLVLLDEDETAAWEQGAPLRTQTHHVPAPQDSVDSHGGAGAANGDGMENPPKFASLSLSLTEISHLQQDDPSLLPWFMEVGDEETGLVITADVLYRVVQDAARAMPWKRLAVPAPLRKTLLEGAHDTPAAGHYGQSATVQRLRARFDWPGLVKDVSQHVAHCDACLRAKEPAPAARPQRIGNVPIYRPNHTIAIDVVGPLTEDKHGNKYLVTQMDAFSRFLTVEAIPANTTDAMLAAMERRAAIFGYPEQYLSDNANQFSKTFSEHLHRRGVTKLTTSSYNPQANGRLERAHLDLKNIMRCAMEDAPGPWSTLVAAATLAYNSHHNRRLGMCPFALVFGYDPLIPLAPDFDLEEQSHERRWQQQQHVWQQELAKRLEAIDRESQDAWDAKPDQEYRVGDPVLLWRPQPAQTDEARKFLRQWQGPYEVIKQHSNRQSYEVQRPGQPTSTTVANARRLKSYPAAGSVAE